MIAEANGITLHYVQAGAGPDVLLLPGLGASTHVWYAQLRALSPVLRVTAVDLRGQGQSARPAGPYSIRMLADDVAALINKLGLAPAAVVGSSMASMVAVELAAAYPERVSALVLAGGFPKLEGPGRERMEARAVAAETEGMGPLADLVPGTALGAHTHATNPALVGLFRALLLSNDPRAYAASCRAIVGCDITPLLGAIRCPALILLGEQEQVAPWPAARALKANIPNADVRVLPHAGHLPFLEQPAAFNAALLEWLAGSLR